MSGFLVWGCGGRGGGALSTFDFLRGGSEDRRKREGCLRERETLGVRSVRGEGRGGSVGSMRWGGTVCGGLRLDA